MFEDAGVAKNAGIDFIVFDPHEKHSDFEGARIFNLMELVQ